MPTQQWHYPMTKMRAPASSRPTKIARMKTKKKTRITKSWMEKVKANQPTSRIRKVATTITTTRTKKNLASSQSMA